MEYVAIEFLPKSWTLKTENIEKINHEIKNAISKQFPIFNQKTPIETKFYYSDEHEWFYYHAKVLIND